MKKVVSFILAMVLVVGLIPAAFASDAPPAEGYEYVFSNAAHTGSADTANHETGGFCKFEISNKTNRELHTIETTVESVSDPWGYVAKNVPTSIGGLGTENDHARVSIYRTEDKNGTDKITFNPESTDAATAVCFEIEVEKGGEFVPAFNYDKYKEGPVVELFLVPKGATVPTNETLSDYVKSLDAKYRIGVADMSDGSSETCRPMELKAGNYYFIIVLNGDGINNTPAKFYYSYPKSLALLPLQKTYTYDISANALAAGKAEEYNTASSNATSTHTAFKGMTSASNETSNWTVANTRYVYGKIYDTYYSKITEDGIMLMLNTWRYCDPDSGNNYFTDDTVGNETLGNCTHAAFVIDIPNAGNYNLSLYNKIAHEIGAYTAVHFVYAEGNLSNNQLTDAKVTSLCTDANRIGYHNSAVIHNTTTNEVFNVTVPEGKTGLYAVVFTTPSGTLDANNKFLTANGTTETSGSGFQTLNLSKIVLEEVVDENATYPGDEEINVNPENATVTGTATISNDVDVLAKDTDGNEVDVTIQPVGNLVTAPQFVGENNKYEFLYWAKGIGYNQKKVSTDLTYNFTKETEKLWLYAVYRNTKEAAKNATFYNANGDIIATVAIEDGKVKAPSLDRISLAGYGAVKGWKYAADGVTYGADAEVMVNGDALFVADYDELNTSIDITATNGTITVEGGKEKPFFGDKVTVTAPARKDNTKLFNYWKKGDEIVSFDREYSFCAWEACTLTAVYTDYVPLAEEVRKIILGKTGDTYVAEFIGFDGANVLERGIAFATEGNASYASINRVVMNRKDLNHLAAVNDIGAKDVVGYVIDKEGNVYYSK